MSLYRVPSASRLPMSVLYIAAIGLVLLWIAIVFWGVIFIAKGWFDFTSFFPTDRYYGVMYTGIGVIFLLQMKNRVLMLRRHGLIDIIKYFLEHRFLELISTAIIMIVVAVLVSLRINFIASTILILPLITGATVGFGIGHFMEEILQIPFASFIVLTSSWLLELFWVYLFSWFFIRVLLRFRLISHLD